MESKGPSLIELAKNYWKTGDQTSILAFKERLSVATDEEKARMGELEVEDVLSKLKQESIELKGSSETMTVNLGDIFEYRTANTRSILVLDSIETQEDEKIALRFHDYVFPDNAGKVIARTPDEWVEYFKRTTLLNPDDISVSPKKKEEKDYENDLTLEEIDYARAAFNWVRSRVGDINEFNTDTKEKGDEKFRELAAQYLNEVAVHGRIKGTEIEEESDLDGRVAVGLMKEAGLASKKVHYVAPGTFKEWLVTVDSGNRNGIVSLYDDKTFPGKDRTDKDAEETRRLQQTGFADHHGKGALNDRSAAYVIYHTMIGLGLIERSETLDRVTEFVTYEDNKSFPDYVQHFRDSSRKFLGLGREAKYEDIKRFFIDHHDVVSDSLRDLTDEELQEYGFIKPAVVSKEYGKATVWEDESKIREKKIEQSLERVEKLKEAGFYISTEKYGDILVDTSGSVPYGFDAAQFAGFGGYLNWNPGNKGLFLSVKNPLPEDFDIAPDIKDEEFKGLKIRETMWVKPGSRNIPMKATLQDIANALAEQEYELSPGLQYFNEKKEPPKELQAAKEVKTEEGGIESLKEVISHSLKRGAKWIPMSNRPVHASATVYFTEEKKARSEQVEVTSTDYDEFIIQRVFSKSIRYKDKSISLSGDEIAFFATADRTEELVIMQISDFIRFAKPEQMKKTETNIEDNIEAATDYLDEVFGDQYWDSIKSNNVENKKKEILEILQNSIIGGDLRISIGRGQKSGEVKKYLSAVRVLGKENGYSIATFDLNPGRAEAVAKISKRDDDNEVVSDEEPPVQEPASISLSPEDQKKNEGIDVTKVLFEKTGIKEFDPEDEKQLDDLFKFAHSIDFFLSNPDSDVFENVLKEQFSKHNIAIDPKNQTELSKYFNDLAELVNYLAEEAGREQYKFENIGIVREPVENASNSEDNTEAVSLKDAEVKDKRNAVDGIRIEFNKTSKVIQSGQKWRFQKNIGGKGNPSRTTELTVKSFDKVSGNQYKINFLEETDFLREPMYLVDLEVIFGPSKIVEEGIDIASQVDSLEDQKKPEENKVDSIVLSNGEIKLPVKVGDKWTHSDDDHRSVMETSDIIKNEDGNITIRFNDANFPENKGENTMSESEWISYFMMFEELSEKGKVL